VVDDAHPESGSHAEFIPFEDECPAVRGNQDKIVGAALPR